MTNVTVTTLITDRELDQIDDLVRRNIFCSRSDAVRYCIRQGIGKAEEYAASIESNIGKVPQ